jgi:hypothetical protein
VRYFLRRRQPPVSRILLVESGSRHLIEHVLPGLRQTYGESIPIDLVTCYPARPRASTRSTASRIIAAPPDAASSIARCANRYSIMGMVCSAEPIMTKWKWSLAARLPVKVFVINENGDYFWLDRGHWRAILHFACFAPDSPARAPRARWAACWCFRSLCCICYSMHQPFIFAAHGAKA